jgi:hypothetical protein
MRYGFYLNEKYGAISNDDDDEPKEEMHEDVEHDHNLVNVEDCSTSWSSDDDDDDQCTTNSLDKIHDDDSSFANEKPTTSTLDDHIDGSCSDGDCNTTTSPSPHYFMSQGNTKENNANG